MTLRQRMEHNDKLFAETGRYVGLTNLPTRETDPLKYESLHLQLRSAVVSARETAKKIAASPGVREVGEMVVALYTPEGDAIALSAGIMVHVHTTSRFIKWMIANDYEENPGINPGDIFANNDAHIGTVQVPDVMDVVPIFADNEEGEQELIAWVGAVAHELEVGGITPGGDVYLAQERFTEGLFVCAEKVGMNDTLRRDYLIRLERNLRMPHYWILDEKAKISACHEVREKIMEIVSQYGLDYYKQATYEAIEEGRRATLERIRTMTVPGRYRGTSFFGHIVEGKPGILPLGAKDLLLNIPMEIEIKSDGKLEIGLDGTSSWGYHSMNCTEAGMDGGLFVTLTQSLNYDGKVNDGAWLATELKLPPGTWCKPDNHFVATATSWALLLPAFGIFQRLTGRAFMARGFIEEVFVGQVNTPMIEVGGTSQYGSMFGCALFECSAAGSGALAISDGLDTSYSGWNPEADMGNAEIWEQAVPMLYMGRTNTVDSGGAGKRRGGLAFTSLWRVHKTPQLIMATSEHSARVFDNAGMCGGYPAPTAFPHYVVRNVDEGQIFANGYSLAHGFGTEPHTTDIEERLGPYGDLEVIEGPHVGPPLQSGDYFAHSYNGGGGYGDPLEREPQDVLVDLEDGKVSLWAAHNLYKVAARFDEDSREWVEDAGKTAVLRQNAYDDRRNKAIPVSDWMATQRPTIESRNFAPEVLDMYRDCFGNSANWKQEFYDFWQLDPDFEL
ncbi:MAG: hydantoinase B/oxoprolinase family protein [Chloroflexota bacterium]